MQVVARIQGHPSRRHLHDALLESIGLPTEVSEHSSDPPSPWAGYRRALSNPPTGATHLVIIQDDALVCRNFAQAVEQIVTRHPAMPVCLFLAPNPWRTARDATRAMKNRDRYVTVFIRDFCPVVGMLWPVEKAQELLTWSADARLPGHPNPRSDDAVVGRWMIQTRQTILATVPSLVQHSGSEPSVKGLANDATTWRALFFAEDGLDFQW